MRANGFRTLPRFLLVSWLAATAAGADEGMWQPYQLRDLTPRLRDLGLELDPASMTRLTDFPMGAVIGLGGCSASFVSGEGLVVTNYHCAQGSVQYNSTPARNLLESGFLAATRADELPAAPGSRVYVTVDATDVTQLVVGDLPADLAGLARWEAIEGKRKLLIEECERDAGHRCSVDEFHGSLEYWRIKRLELRDVRLAYAPAGAIGEYGGEIDNWMWPRHTGDFAFFRAYVGPDGKPADHAAGNVPYRPRHHLPIARSGPREGDLVLVLGYPGSTRRHVTARELEHAFAWSYPRRRERYQTQRETIERTTTDRPDAAIRYASSVAGLDNAIKNFGGMIEGYARRGLLERKQRDESELRAWVAADPVRQARHGDAITELDAAIARYLETRERDLVLDGMAAASDLLATARRLYRLSREREKPDAERESGYQERDLLRLRERLVRLERRFDPDVDRALWSLEIERYLELPAEQRLPAVDAFLGLGGDAPDWPERLRRAYAATGLTSTDRRLAWLEASRAAIEAAEDPFLRLAVAGYDADLAREREEKVYKGELQRLRPRYMQARIEFERDRGRAVYADANNTLRITFGTVRGYRPRDGMSYEPFTRLEGIVEKNTGRTPFAAPAAELAAIRERRHGPWAVDWLDSVPVNFLSSVDATGGNSGSPTINARGELVGLLFDGTLDSVGSDWDYDPEHTRSIHVDARYMLWVLSEVEQATALRGELGFPPAKTRTGATEED